MSGDFDWTEASVQKLEALWAEGLSTAEIGRRIGVSKNAVVSKAGRLGLSRPSPIKRDGESRPAKPHAVRRPKKTLPALASAAAQPLAMPAPASVASPALRLARAGEICRYILNEARPWRFCDAAAEPGTSWCAKHRAVVFVSPEQAKQMWGYRG